MNTSFLKSVFCIALISLCLTRCQKDQKTDFPLEIKKQLGFNFSKVDGSSSGITFKNVLTPDMTSMVNLFDYDYFYNGAGVGIADLNNDGLQDVFFCGNQTDNKLYINKGNLKFEDISSSANINQNKNWSTGVSFADINQDGYLDIYVSQGGPFREESRKNLLFINNQDLTFSESAALYGLDDPGISTQSSFADFDQDGDLDCIVMNEAELYGYDLIPFYEKVNFNKQTKYFNTSHIYENVKGRFIDRTPLSSFDQPSFGLGLMISDLNNDNLPDIYIANDYFVPDAMYINKGDFEFQDEIKNRTNQVSFFGMGMDIADINNDCAEDIFVLDMAAKDHYRAKTLMASMNTSFFDLLTNQIGFIHQYMYNSLQLNDGNGGYNNIAQLSGISSTDWSWTGLIEDLDNDGFRDIYVTNGYRKYALDNDFKAKIRAAKIKFQGNIPIDVKEDLYNQIPEEKLANILYRNNGDLTFSDITKVSHLDIPTYSNGGAVADFDNDGDMDLIVNNIDEEAILLKNNAAENGNKWIQIETSSPSGNVLSKVTINYSGKSQFYEIKSTRGYMSSSQGIAHFGLGNTSTIDSIRVEWIDGSMDLLLNQASNQKIKIRKGSRSYSKQKQDQQPLFAKTSLGKFKLSFKHNEDYYDDFAKETLLPHKQSTSGPTIRTTDFNNDSIDDLFIGGAKGQSSRLYIQTSEGTFDRKEFEIPHAEYEDIDASFIDLDNDGNEDIIIASGGNSDTSSQAYRNRILSNTNGKLSSTYLPGVSSPSSKVISADFDKDGDIDVIIGNRMLPQQYPLPSTSTYLENNNGDLFDKTESVSDALTNLGIVNDMIATDINNDGWIDVIAVGEWTGVQILINDQGILKKEETELNSLVGWWNSMAEIDINNDGLKDFVVGNVGLNTKYKASFSKPLKIFAQDFDQNGSLDIVLSKKYKDEYVPFRGKECSSQQMPFIKEKFPTYDLFAKASLEEVYEGVDEAYNRAAVEFRSLLLINEGSGKFSIQALPNEAQLIPIKDMVVIDLNKDGFDDIIAVGNIYNTEVETPRMDYNSAIILYSNGTDNFTPVSTSNLGMKIDGNAKSIEKIAIKNKEYIIIGVNDGLLNLFEIL